MAVREMKGPNRLLMGLILFSFVVHFFLYLPIWKLLKSRVFTYIELTMTDTSKPEARAIPRPRPRPKTPEIQQEVKRIQVTRPVQPVKQIKIDPVDDNYQEGLMEGITVPDVDSDLSGTMDDYRITDYLGNSVEFGSQKDYYEMVMLRIESVKNYPEQAKQMQKEGKVTIQFVITLTGTVKDIQIIEPCRHEQLNKAALKAVSDAAPFPRPPKRFFKEALSLQVRVIFETT